MKKKIFVFSLVLSFFFLFNPQKTIASKNFTTDYNTVYKVNKNGITTVSVSGVLTNKTKNIYPSSYQLKVGFDNVSNVVASDPQGKIEAKVAKIEKGNIITIKFNKKVLGEKNKLSFKISFDTDGVVNSQGNVFEINIPGISNPSEFEKYDVEVIPPPDLGKPSFMKPDFGKNLKFDKNQLNKSGIVIMYGQKKVYNFKVKYNLKNSNFLPNTLTIALPSDNNYQSVYLNKINPAPINVTKDTDGNWIAEYRLMPLETKKIEASGQVELGLAPEKQQISENEKNLYTKPTKYWQSADKEILQKAKELRTAEDIYNFVIKTLKYDFKNLNKNKPRLGAVNALKNPSAAVCREFTDLFIALSRAAGIPAREVNGFAYTNNTSTHPVSLEQDILHAWPEYYDFENEKWVMVDPTWGATTGGIDYFNQLDFDHFAFVIKGANDSTPIPAGGYKLNQSKNDISVSVAKKLDLEKQNIEIKLTSSDKQVAGFAPTAKIKITNLGPKSIKKQEIIISSSLLKPKNQATTLSEIPPFGYGLVDAKFEKNNFLTNMNVPLKIQFAGKSVKKTIKIVPFFKYFWD